MQLSNPRRPSTELMPRMPIRCTLPKVVLDLFERWRGFEHALHAVAFNGHIQRFAGARTDDALHLGKAVDWRARRSQPRGRRA
jgi:hypothetical protein